MNYYKKIKENLKSKYTSGNIEEKNLLLHLVEILGEDGFNKMIKDRFTGNYPDTFDNFYDCPIFNSEFEDFHKSLRQTDFYYNYANIQKNSGNLDMIWWNFIYISSVTYTQFRILFDKEF